MISNECPVKNSSLKFPDETALIEGELEISYIELNRRIDSVLLSLEKLDLKPGMKVGIISENSIQYIVLVFALLRIDCVVVPFNFRFSYREIEKVVSGIGLDAVISDMFTEELSLSGLNVVMFADLASDSAVETKNSERITLINGSTIILTSGSTGIPKGVLLSYENHYYSAAGSNMNIKLKGGDRWLLLLPLYHVGGLAILFRAFLAGVTVSLPSGRGSGIGNEIDSGGITHVSMVHTQIGEYVNYLEKRGKYSSESLKVLLAGGSYIPESLIKRAIDLKIPVYKTYGLTEMSSQVTTTEKKVSKKCRTTSGSLLKYRDLRIGAGGEILVRGRTLFEGYISEGKFLPVEIDPGGWFATGDLGYISESGGLVLTGRKDNMFISGGENIFPEEIESELLKINSILEAIVVPVKDVKFGKRPTAFINCGDMDIKKSEITEILRKVLPGFKIPDKFYYLEDIGAIQLKRRRGALTELAEKKVGLKELSD